MRRPGLVNEDRIYLVHNGKGVAPLDLAAQGDGHIVPQVVKPKLIVGAIGNIGGVGGLLLGRLLALIYQPHRQPKEAVDLAHLFAVPPGQVVVHGDHMDPLTRQGVEVGREGGHQGLALASFHLGDTALVEDDPANQLDTVGIHAQYPLCRLPAGGKGIWENVLQALPCRQPAFQFYRLALELRVR